VTDTDIDTNRWVLNLSDRQISDDEWSIHSKGLNFAITPTTLLVEEIAKHKYKNRMINILRKWKRNGSISDKLYWKLYPESEEPQKLYGTPKIHKNNTPIRPIVSSCGSITYNAAKHLASILSPPLCVRTVTASKTPKN